mgnify:CR=1 FL=1
MIPFRVFDKENKTTWIVLNYHSNTEKYLVAREDDSSKDGDLNLISAEELSKLRLVDFYDENE